MKKLFPLLLCLILILSGCTTTKASSSADSQPFVADEKEKSVYTSKIQKSDCSLCSQAGNTLLPIYAGQKNVGIICINTFDMSSVSINRYNDNGKLCKEPAGNMGMTINNFGEGGMFTMTSTVPDRGYANVDVSFSKDKTIDKQKVEKLFCQDCLDSIMEDVWHDPYGIGVINFETLEIKMFEENVTAFTFGDYYIDIDRHENSDDPDHTKLDLLIFYCPPRYQ